MNEEVNHCLDGRSSLADEIAAAPCAMSTPIPLTICGDHTLGNGRTYRITDTREPYTSGEYPAGGLHIAVLHRGAWVYIDNAPSETEAREFLRHCARLAPFAVH